MNKLNLKEKMGLTLIIAQTPIKYWEVRYRAGTVEGVHELYRVYREVIATLI